LSWAMPEVTIGFGPDVGGTYLLSRAPGELGTHIALTAARVGPADAIACGFADSFVAVARIGELRERLIGEDVDEAIAAAAGFGDQLAAEELTLEREAIDSCYAGNDGLAILRRLRAEQSDFCAAAAEALEGGSPTSVIVTPSLSMTRLPSATCSSRMAFKCSPVSAESGLLIVLTKSRRKSATRQPNAFVSPGRAGIRTSGIFNSFAMATA